VRFGETFSRDDAFNTTTADPLRDVRVSVLRRPVEGRPRSTHAVFVIVNEGHAAVRDQLYILDPGSVFGGPNSLDNATVVDLYDFSSLPNNSDWGKPGVRAVTSRGNTPVLQDLEDNGVVFRASSRDGMETYGPTIFVPPHGFRLLYGRGK
jgi:hypothetical protein